MDAVSKSGAVLGRAGIIMIINISYKMPLLTLVLAMLVVSAECGVVRNREKRSVELLGDIVGSVGE